MFGNQKKIGIIEFDISNHYIYLYTLIKILVNNDYKVKVFCYKQMYEKIIIMILPNLNVEFIILDSNKSFISQIKKINRNLSSKYSNSDILWVNTLQLGILRELSIFVFLKTKIYSVLTIHNSNSWFKNDLKSLITLEKPICKKILYIVHFFMRKNLLKKFNGINVLEEKIVYNVQKNIKYITKDIFLMPFSAFEFESYSRVVCKTDNCISIIVPGMITQKRKDYKFLLNALENNPHWRIKVILLGRAIDKSGKQIIDWCNKLINKGINIKYFEDFISNETFETEMHNATFIYGNPVKDYLRLGINEEYSISKSSGLTFSIIKYAKPGILPDWYQVSDLLESSIYRFNGYNQLCLLLNELSNLGLDELNKINDVALSNSLNFELKDIKFVKYNKML